MSALGLVTGRLAPGVWRADATSRIDLATLASGLGWSIRTGLIAATGEKSVYLSSLGLLAGVPDYVRPNWDSLADGLRDTGIEGRRLLLIETSESMPFDAIAVDVLQEAAIFWARQGEMMQVVWFGPVTAPQLDQIDPARTSRSRPR